MALCTPWSGAGWPGAPTYSASNCGPPGDARRRAAVRASCSVSIYVCVRQVGTPAGVPAREHAWILTAIGTRWEFPDGAASLSGGARYAEHVRRGRPILGGLCV